MENNKENMNNTCDCKCGGWCACGHGGHKHHMMKKLFMLIVLVIAFCAGTQYGELKSYSNMMRGGAYGMMNGGHGTMRGFNKNSDTNNLPQILDNQIQAPTPVKAQ